MAIPIDFCLSSLTYFSFVTAFSGSATKEATQYRGAAGRRPLGTRHNIAFVEFELIGVTVFVRQLGKLKVHGRQELVCYDRRTSTSGSVQAGGASFVAGSRDLLNEK